MVRVWLLPMSPNKVLPMCPVYTEATGEGPGVRASDQTTFEKPLGNACLLDICAEMFYNARRYVRAAGTLTASVLQLDIRIEPRSLRAVRTANLLQCGLPNPATACRSPKGRDDGYLDNRRQGCGCSYAVKQWRAHRSSQKQPKDDRDTRCRKSENIGF